MSDALPAEQGNGRVVTFYSYKGGTGRTMALANVAWILASNGYRVLAADWDLESPGLHRFFAPFLDNAARDAHGIIDMVRDYEWEAGQHRDDELREAHIAQHARVKRFAVGLRHWTFPDGGSLEYLSPGKQDTAYLATLSALDWDNFYHSLNGGDFLDALRNDLKANYDYALIDSRTGLSDIADVCTAHLPDVLVDCFTLSTQGVDGAAAVAKNVDSLYGWRIRVLPVPMRVDPSEQERVENGRQYAQHQFEGLPVGMSAQERQAYWANVEVPYRPYYAYEEMLATFGDTTSGPGSMLSAYERITRYVTDGAVTKLPPIDDELRNRTRARFDRRVPVENRQLTIEYLPQDHLWAEWLMAVLAAGGYAVRERRLGPQPADSGEQAEDPRSLTVVSEAYLAWRRDLQAAGEAGSVAGNDPDDGADGRSRQFRPGLAASVLSVARPLPEFVPEATVQLGSVRGEAEAIDRLERQFRFAIDAANAPALPRYPALGTAHHGVGVPVAAFTGRERELRELRDQLRGAGTAVVRPVTLLGTAGAGKTAIALEYVHRYLNDYDLVCWVPCGHPAEIDVRLADLESVIEDRFGRRMSSDAGSQQRADAVLRVLGDGETVPSWLLVYDNAEDVDAVRRWLPSSGGQVLITSQNQAWEDHGARALRIRMFERAESLAYLRREVRHIIDEDAERLAAMLGDMPLALAATAAHLRDTGYPVASYLSDMARSHSAASTSGGALSAYPPEVLAALAGPLAQLSDRSPAAFRLLQLCSLMAPEIGLSLVYSNAMADALRPLDPALVEPMILRRVVKDASNLNLLTADSATGLLMVHRVVHGVVRDRMTPREAADARAEVRRILLAARPRRDADDPATWSRYRLIWPHLAPAAVASAHDERVRQLMIDRIRYINIFGDFSRGVTEGNAVADGWEEMLAAGLDPTAERALRTQLLQLRFNVGISLLRLSEFTAARELHAQVLDEQTRLLGPDHPHALATAITLAADLRALGLYRDALRLDQQTHASWVSLYGDDYLFTLRAANNLAVSYRVNGDWRAAQELDTRTYQYMREAEGEEHALTLTSARNLARDLIEAGEYRAAVDRATSAYEGAVATMGRESMHALEAQVVLGITLRGAGLAQQAQQQFDEALSLLRDQRSGTGSAVLACRLSRAVNLAVLDQYEAAEAEIVPVLAEYQRVLGPSHPHTLVCQVNLAATLRQRQAPERAATELAAALDGLNRVLGPEHPYTLAAQMVDGILLADRGETRKAVDTTARTAAALGRALGPAHPDTLRCRANLLLTRRDLGEDSTADLARVIGQLELLLGADHQTIGTLRKNRRLLRALDPQPF